MENWKTFNTKYYINQQIVLISEIILINIQGRFLFQEHFSQGMIK
jgi:hypothetical protein